jgi:hypothetical protein
VGKHFNVAYRLRGCAVRGGVGAMRRPDLGSELQFGPPVEPLVRCGRPILDRFQRMHADGTPRSV